DLLFNLSNNIKSITQTTSINDLNSHQQDTLFLLDNIQPNFTYLEQQALPFNNAFNAKNLTAKFNQLRELLNNDTGIYAQQNKVLKSTIAAAQNFEHFQQQFITTEGQLIELNKLADERFNALQTNA
ncbi:hypothetical protein, partial [Psychrobacter sp. TB20-MNA-CIBAN-0197]